MSQTFKDIVRTIESGLAAMENGLKNGRYKSQREASAEHMPDILSGIHEAADKMTTRGHHKTLRTLAGKVFTFMVDHNEKLLWLLFVATLEAKGAKLRGAEDFVPESN